MSNQKKKEQLYRCPKCDKAILFKDEAENHKYENCQPTQKPSGECECFCHCTDENCGLTGFDHIQECKHCHPTPKDEGWEKEFDARFTEELWLGDLKIDAEPTSDRLMLKDFISQERKKVKEETIEELRGQLWSLKNVDYKEDGKWIKFIRLDEAILKLKEV